MIQFISLIVIGIAALATLPERPVSVSDFTVGYNPIALGVVLLLCIALAKTKDHVLRWALGTDITVILAMMYMVARPATSQVYYSDFDALGRGMGDVLVKGFLLLTLIMVSGFTATKLILITIKNIKDHH